MAIELKKEHIDELLLEDIESDNHPSEFELGKDYAVLILRLPEMSDNGLQVISYAFVIKDGVSFRFNREVKELVPSGSLHDLYEFLDQKTDQMLKDIQRYHYEIEMLEESLYDGAFSSDFMQKWLAYKKDVSLIHRLMFHAGLAFEQFVNHHKRRDDFKDLAYADLFEHIGRIRDLAKAAMEKLDNLYDFYRAKVDERMNRNMYWLTIISAIFLPLTLVTGFFGMNTGGLPYTQTPDGTFKAVVVSLILEALFLAPFIFMNIKKVEKFHFKFKK
ncbi:CorA family divalent cation transporter [Hydrogenimonas thermophila]|uniref:Magnesium transporter n=1 Tax=Hydrogenimonas thermophila TaxID=223786 RepID=A0A1I5S3R3_9BACT|nr:CorA family divalent cation transporter [Hydrogenimonas thermophila]SFP64906.1 magnesium transporter [Hydrogenimonas thermophila]